MGATYQGQQIKSSRPARQGDQGFDKSQGEQVVITLQDGTEKTVAKSEVQGTDQSQRQGKQADE